MFCVEPEPSFIIIGPSSASQRRRCWRCHSLLTVSRLESSSVFPACRLPLCPIMAVVPMLSSPRAVASSTSYALMVSSSSPSFLHLLQAQIGTYFRVPTFKIGRYVSCESLFTVKLLLVLVSLVAHMAEL